jgi:predicted membrane-bound spermidine synthase
MQLNKRLYFISFIEGGAVMAAELCGAKLLAPLFGNSLHVWSAVMAITLGGLASGYFFGGFISKKNNKEKLLFTVLCLASICLLVMPHLQILFYYITNVFPFMLAVVLSVFVLLFPVTMLMGCTSPLIISILTANALDSGENSGKIYGVSTVGGIVATFLSGFYLIPNYGIKVCLTVFAILLCGVTLLLFLKKKSNQSFYLIFVVILFYSFKAPPLNKNTVYKIESLLGTIEVRDELDLTDSLTVIRKLLVNNIAQSEMNLSTHKTASDYVKLVESNFQKKVNGKALVVGLGGGMFANTLHHMGYEVTAVEYDKHIIDVARKYFYLNDSVKTICSDARYFMNQSKQKYDLVLFDVFKGEEQPSHIITLESLSKLKNSIDSNTTCVVNTYGFYAGVYGLGNQCLLQTFIKAGFNIKICTYSDDEDYRNLIIYASLKKIDRALKNQISFSTVITDAFANTDNQPVLDFLNANASQRFRELYFKNYISFHFIFND